MTYSNKCCGEVRATPFCPVCGKKMQHPRLVSLLEHCRTHERPIARYLERCKTEGKQPRGLTVSHYAKWHGWVLALENALADMGCDVREKRE